MSLELHRPIVADNHATTDLARFKYELGDFAVRWVCRGFSAKVSRIVRGATQT